MLTMTVNSPQISFSRLQKRHSLSNGILGRQWFGNVRPLISPSLINFSLTIKRSSTCMCVANTDKLENASTLTATKISFPVMVNGCAGNMGRAVAEAALSAGLQLVPLSLTSPNLRHQRVQIGEVEVDVRSASEKDAVFDSVLNKYPDVVVVDYTVPSAVNENAEFYCRIGVPFVMGTTGGDREKLVDVVQKSNNYAVIAPQMGKQVVAFQAAMEIMAQQFPGAFSGYKLEVIESHQSSKVDTSGTAKAIVSCFQKLGVSYDLDEGLRGKASSQRLLQYSLNSSARQDQAMHRNQQLNDNPEDSLVSKCYHQFL
ncbi:hypothetical protein KI387_006874 [Taxus chinensis]|uniref:4-hydroxy-tetrahydrodipicolinate reductase n=1 Tax=Taxus chinensis TaxID=29808 RepID=A0AA38GQA9_TAXCH|nr:hypothetical protein KI387_006874 [Taxus chinensis]